MKMYRIYRTFGQDYTEFSIYKYRINLTARPIRMWHLFWWGWMQSPWLTISIRSGEYEQSR